MVVIRLEPTPGPPPALITVVLAVVIALALALVVRLVGRWLQAGSVRLRALAPVV
ncbi:hypothetical protein [Nonomuraea sp. NPDC049480]|uniref:hypothetical protein n=1 Tax=Nonomuraea sp. NPDC049480 TaxID=3364353 RepID=UPI0037BD3E58